MKKLSWRYLAGLIDGEGCIDWSFNFDKKYNAKYMRPRLRITLAEPGFDVIVNGLCFIKITKKAKIKLYVLPGVGIYKRKSLI